MLRPERRLFGRRVAAWSSGAVRSARRGANQPPKCKPPRAVGAGQPEWSPSGRFVQPPRAIGVAAIHGITLIELLITMVLMSALVVVIWGVFNTGFMTTVTESLRSSIKGDSGRGFIRMGTELRPALSVTSAQQTSITFTADTDNDGAAETIQYTWNGTSGQPLNRVSGGTYPLVNSISVLSFSYYDSNHNLLSFPVTASQVKGVGADITVANQDESFRLRSEYRLRNL